MFCPIRPTNSGGCIRECYGKDCALHNGKDGCMITDALKLIIYNQKEEKKLRALENDETPWEYNWGGVE